MFQSQWHRYGGGEGTWANIFQMMGGKKINSPRLNMSGTRLIMSSTRLIMSCTRLIRSSTRLTMSCTRIIRSSTRLIMS